VAVLDTVFDVHALLGTGGEVAGDFYDGCLIYEFTTGRLSLVDLAPRACREQPDRRYGSLPEFCAAWTAACGAAGPARSGPARPRAGAS
jgi:serine/threonine-protein kinase